jgi:MFS family permease
MTVLVGLVLLVALRFLTLTLLVASNVGWKSLIATPGNRKRMRIIVALAFFSQWSGNGLVSYYLTKVFVQIGITNSSTQLLINGILQIWNFGWAVFAAFMVNKLGRRFLFLLSASLMTLFYMAQAICFAEYAEHGHPAAGHAVIAFIFLFYAAYDIAFTPLIVSYTVEILPYNIRAKGFNIFNFVISLALIFNQYVNPIALEAMSWKYYVSLWILPCSEFLLIGYFRSYMSAGSLSNSSSCGSSSLRPRTGLLKKLQPSSMVMMHWNRLQTGQRVHTKCMKTDHWRKNLSAQTTKCLELNFSQYPTAYLG